MDDGLIASFDKRCQMECAMRHSRPLRYFPRFFYASKYDVRTGVFGVMYRVEQKNLANFSDTCSVRANGLSIGSPRLVGGRKAGNSNMQEFFCTPPYRIWLKDWSQVL